MTYELAIGDRIYSSWSLRGWLLFEKFDIAVKTRTARMFSPGFKTLLAEFPPARLVPAIRYDGIVVSDTLAIAETLAERHGDKSMWPQDPAARALARSLSAEMHASFAALRKDCPMNLRRCYAGFQPSGAVLKDVARAEELWGLARNRFGQTGPWLFGEYSIADAFFAPLAMRFATYELPRGAIADAYIKAHLNDRAFRRWRAMGLANGDRQQGYDLDLPEKQWPGPRPLAAKPVREGPSVNALCPYSQKPVTDFMELEGRIFGFCNRFCRDKTVADPEAWPAFMTGPYLL